MMMMGNFKPFLLIYKYGSIKKIRMKERERESERERVRERESRNSNLSLGSRTPAGRLVTGPPHQLLLPDCSCPHCSSGLG